MSNFQEWCVKVLPFIQAAASGEVVQGSCDYVGEWFDLDSAPACDPALTFDFDDYDYRIKPLTIMIGDVEVPEPMREEPRSNTYYYFPLICEASLSSQSVWLGYEMDRSRLSCGMAHNTREAATTHAKALIALTAKKDASHE